MKNIEKSANIGVDLGGTNLRAALVDRRGKILESRMTRVPLEQGAKAISNELAAQCRTLVHVAAGLDLEVCAVGLGVAGKIDRASGSVIFSPNLPALDGYPLGRDLARDLGISVFMENDANAFGLGEGWTGAARGVRNWAGITRVVKLPTGGLHS